MSVCIYFHPEAYSTKGEKLMGRNAAGESFLRGFFLHAKPSESLWVLNEDEEETKNYRNLARSYNRTENVVSINKKKYRRLKDASALYFPGPELSDLAWKRRFFGDDAWSICGITHTTASARAMDSIVNLVSSPIKEWDGLICTSTAVKGHVENILEAQKEYLKTELGATRFSLPQMPVIPLGVHLEDFVFTDQVRSASRNSLGIDSQSIVVLYVGRLSFHAKAHPLQMYKALESAAETTSKNLVLIECGWAANDYIKKAFSEAAREICPSVRVINLDGRVAVERDKAWSSADIFCSLSDNIQETFGIVPLEGMAAGLPVVVSDWNGYKDTVSDGVEGFRIPSIAPGAGLGGDLAYRHAIGIDTYDMYCGFSSSFVGVNIEVLSDTFCRLAEDKSLRLSMGAKGREKIKSRYDWVHVIKTYEDFWDDLTERRKVSTKKDDLKSQQPKYLDPFEAFSHYPSKNLDLELSLSLINSDKSSAIDLVSEYRKMTLVNYVNDLLPSAEMVSALINASSDRPRKVEEIIKQFDGSSKYLARRALAWLVKLGVYKFK